MVEVVVAVMGCDRLALMVVTPAEEPDVTTT
jgi:hypothetical protein